MALYISSINSGSNGNCYYIGNAEDAVLIDAGISCREIEKRMLRNGLSMQKVRAVFISHEHSDHIKGLEVLARKYNIPVYINQLTLKNSSLVLNPDLTFCFRDLKEVNIGSLKVIPFLKHHDAADPFSFCVTYNGVKIGVFTDLGVVCDALKMHFSTCHAAFLESNYDTELLSKSSYPYFLKRRISGGKGHLSNDQALRLFLEHKPAFMSHLFLAHLSKNNNDPHLAESYFRKHAGTTHIGVASRDKEGEVYLIRQQPVKVHFETAYSLNPQTTLF